MTNGTKKLNKDLEIFQAMIEYFWEQAIPVDEADWATAK